MRITIAALATLLMLTDASATELVPTEGGTIEQQLAVVNAGHLVKVDDITIARFRYLLSSIHEASGVDPRAIALLLMKGKEIDRTQYGKDISLLDLTEVVNRLRDEMHETGGTKDLAMIIGVATIQLGQQ